MWILPKQLHTLASVQVTEGLISDLEEQSQACGQSLFLRSKVSLARTWSQKWKRDSWTQHLSGRILKPSHGQSFVTAWTSSLGAIPANHSQPQESDLEPTTLDIFGPSSQAEFGFSDQECVSLKTSRDISRWGCPTLSKTWDAWVTKQRGEYSLRVKSAHLTNASGSSSWPTANARDWKDSITGTHPPSRPNLSEQTLGQAVSVAHGQAAPVNPSTGGSRQGLWATPRGAMASMYPEYGQHWNDNRGGESIATQVWKEEQWATPQTRDNRSGGRERWDNPNRSKNLNDQIATKTTQNAKLNSRWVETLMGLPVGWTMPSCASPVTTELTSCDYWETESFRPPASERSELSWGA